jgi:Do/DeqQ family serine protease
MKKIGLIFIAALMGGMTSIGVYKIFEDQPKKQALEEENIPTKMVNLISGAPEVGADYVTAAEMTVNAVVHVKTEGTRELTQYGFDPFRELFYGNGNIERKYSQPIKGAGSGVIISPDGYIVTNNHVVEHSEKINITLNNSKSYEARVIGLDPTTDLALLKIDEKELPSVEFANSDQTRVGEWVLAVGNPFNLTSTVTAGIISAKARDINILGNDPYTGASSIESFIQTDAAVNPGNSGGALVNTKGELVGINAAIKSNTGSYAGYSFAIPSNLVKKVVEDLKEYGSVQRAFIGINIRNIDEGLAQEKDLDDLNGVYVSGLSDDGSAKKAGLKEGDVIKKIDNSIVNNVPQLQEKLGQKRPGDVVDVTVLRDGELLTKTVTLKNIEGSTAIIKKEEKEILRTLGVRLSAVEKEELEELEIEHGVKVDELLPGKMKSTGMSKGFIILKVDNEIIKSPEEFTSVIESKTGGVLIEGIYPDGKRAYYGLGL